MLTRNLLLTAVLTLVACGRGASDLDDADDAVETSTSTSSESALVSAAADGVTGFPTTASDDELATTASVKMKGSVSNGCATVTQKGNVVTYVMVDCTGRYGLVKVSGTMTVTYTRQLGGTIKVDAQGTGLKVNEGTLDLSVVALYTKTAAGLETASVTTHGTGTGKRGNTAERNGTYVLVRDSAAACVTLNGTWSTSWNGSRAATSSTTVADLQKCSGACPAAGGVITHTRAAGKAITVTLDGTSTAGWATGAGKAGTVQLECR